MSRIVSVWLPRWPIRRFLAAQARNLSGEPVDPQAPFVLAAPGSGGPRIAALNEAAEAAGLMLGEPLADARAKAGEVQTRAIDSAADDAALRRLALWATRYTPTASPWCRDLWGEENGADGFFLDIAGAAHLFGGEERLLADLSLRLEKKFVLPARLAVADTPGTAWALARFHTSIRNESSQRAQLHSSSPCKGEDRWGSAASPPALMEQIGTGRAANRLHLEQAVRDPRPDPPPFRERERVFASTCDSVILPSGCEAQALAPLPVEALRLSPDTCRTLRRLGFKTIGALLDKPRAPFAARFPAELLRRIDQALGRIEEPLIPIVAPPVYHTLRYLLEPLFTQEAIVALASRLMQTLMRVLTRDNVGARGLRLSLYNVDGAVETIDIALTLPSRNVAHMIRLIDLKLEKLAAAEDAGFGFEAVGLAVTRAERIAARQDELIAPSLPSPASGGGFGAPRDACVAGTPGWGHADRAERCAVLVDTLRQRLGPRNVLGFAPVASHLPERAEMLQPVTAETLEAWPEPEQKTRPLLILPRAEPTEVIALIPDGPPRRFRWRGVTYEVAGSEGPERIASEWWRQSNGHRSPGPTRDYYLVEDSGGHRFWLYREGLYERETTAARWFVHGLFA
jgi:protein ImuB